MYNWSAYISEANIEAFKKEYASPSSSTTLRQQRGAHRQAPGRGLGYDIAAPTAEYVPGMAEEGFIQKLDHSRIPNFATSTHFQEPVVGPDQRVPGPQGLRDDRRPVPLDTIPSVPKSWKEFYDLVKGAASGKTVFVDSMGDVMVFPLKMLGYSLNSVDQKELDEAQTILLDVAPHLLASTPTSTARRWPTARRP